jgi:thymidylate synthase (FAD)
MTVQLLHHTPLSIADIAICKCYGNEPHSDNDKVKARINRVANVSKHASTIEHLTYTFDIDGISRACLQELARHRIASYTVKSSRYTLQELKDAKDEDLLNFIVDVKDDEFDLDISHQLSIIRGYLKRGYSNDKVKYLLPEAYKTSLVMTINARALQNFLELRSSKHALWEIQLLAKAMYDVLPNDHKFLYENIIQS